MADEKSDDTKSGDTKSEDLATQAEANTGVSSAALNPVYLTTAEDDVPKRFRAKSDSDSEETGTDDAAREEFQDKPATSTAKVVEPLKEEDSKSTSRKGKGDA